MTAPLREPRWADQTISNPGPKSARTSWWLAQPRDGFTARAQQEVPAMSRSTLGQATRASRPEEK